MVAVDAALKNLREVKLTLREQEIVRLLKAKTPVGEFTHLPTIAQNGNDVAL